MLICEGAACGRNVHFIACPPEVVRLIAECAWRSLLFFGCCRWPQCIGELAGAQCALVPRTRAVDTTSMDRYRACGMLHLFTAAAVRVMNACVRFSCIAKAVLALGVALSLEEELDLTRATPSPSTVPRYQWYVVAAYIHSLRSQSHVFCALCTDTGFELGVPEFMALNFHDVLPLRMIRSVGESEEDISVPVLDDASESPVRHHGLHCWLFTHCPQGVQRHG